MSIIKKPFQEACGVFRSGDSDIFHGFGMTHNQDISAILGKDEIYLIYQTNTEAIQLFAEALLHIAEGDARWGDIRWDDTGYQVYAEIRVGEEWHEEEIISKKVAYYRINVEGEDMSIGAYDAKKSFIASALDFPKQLQKHYPMMLGLILGEFIHSKDFRQMMLDYCQEPTAVGLAGLYEHMQKRHYSTEFYVNYTNVYRGSAEELHSYVEEIARKPKTEYAVKDQAEVLGFPEGSFKEEYLDLIPKLGDQYMFPVQLYPLSDAIACGDVNAVLFHGPAGTGKTIACKLIAERIGMPIMDTVNCTENLDEFVLGKYVPEGKSIVFKESYVTKAIRDGGAVVFEEINFAKPQYLAFLNSLLDDNGFVRLDNGEVVRRNPNFRFFATMNVGYFGTRELNQALYNRFQTIVEISDLADEAIRRMLVERVPDCEGFVDTAIKVFHQIKDKIRREELDVVISPRNLESWMRMCKYEDVQDAAEKTIISIAKGDRELELDLRLLIKQSCRR